MCSDCVRRNVAMATVVVVTRYFCLSCRFLILANLLPLIIIGYDYYSQNLWPKIYQTKRDKAKTIYAFVSTMGSYVGFLFIALLIGVASPHQCPIPEYNPVRD